jgi:hypothetical protein
VIDRGRAVVCAVFASIRRPGVPFWQRRTFAGREFGHFQGGPAVVRGRAMTRQFHARLRSAQKPKPREPRQHMLSFTCFRLVPLDDLGPDAYEIIELCDSRNAMRALVFER